IDNGQLSQLGANFIFNKTIFIPIGAPPKIGVQSIGFNYKAGSTITAFGLTLTTPASLSGTLGWLFAPLGPLTPQGAPNVLDGHGHFTALGTATAKIPNIVPVVGGQTLGGVSAVLSDAGAGAVVTVDPPFLDPFTIGAGLTWSPLDFSIIKSLTPFITFTPA